MKANPPKALKSKLIANALVNRVHPTEALQISLSDSNTANVLYGRKTRTSLPKLDPK